MGRAEYKLMKPLSSEEYKSINRIKSKLLKIANKGLKTINRQYNIWDDITGRLSQGERARIRENDYLKKLINKKSKLSKAEARGLITERQVRVFNRNGTVSYYNIENNKLVIRTGKLFIGTFKEDISLRKNLKLTNNNIDKYADLYARNEWNRPVKTKMRMSSTKYEEKFKQNNKRLTNKDFREIYTYDVVAKQATRDDINLYNEELKEQGITDSTERANYIRIQFYGYEG